MRYTTISGIVLKRQPFGEADELLTVWSWEQGKVRLRVRGVRRGRSRLKSAVATLVWLQYHVVNLRQLPLVIGVQTVQSYAAAGRSFQRTALLLALFELVLRTTADGMPNPSISSLMRQCLEYLNTPAAVAPDYFINLRLRLLAALGYRLAVDRCASCGRSLGARECVWDFSAMGFLCSDCRGPRTVGIKLDQKAFASLRVIQSAHPAEVSAAPAILAVLDQWLVGIFTHLTERELGSAGEVYRSSWQLAVSP